MPLNHVRCASVTSMTACMRLGAAVTAFGASTSYSTSGPVSGDRLLTGKPSGYT